MGHEVRKARSNAADAHDAAAVFLYGDSSIAPLLDLRRRLKAVMDVLDRILGAGPVCPVTLDDFHAAGGAGIGDFLRFMSDLHHWLSVFLFTRLWSVVGMRPFGGGGIGCMTTNLYTRISGFDLTWCFLLLFLLCKPHLTPGVSGVLADPAGIDEELRNAWLPYFCRSGQREIR